MPFGTTHYSLRALAKGATQAFFSRVLVEGQEEVPDEGPVIACANHWNAAVDVSPRVAVRCSGAHGGGIRVS